MKTRIYFPNLNGLRFFAAFFVIILHIEKIKLKVGMPNFSCRFLDDLGILGVVLFFVLSGFLISFLLFSEEKNDGRINLKVFYQKRMKRIWPLYYLIVFLAFFILPHIPFFESTRDVSISDSADLIALLLFLLILPNVALIKFGPIPFASQSWSIGVEEQFYIFWPIILKIFNAYKLRCIIFTLTIFLFFKILIYYKFSHVVIWGCSLISLFSMFNLFCMAMGGLFGYFLFTRHFILRLLVNKVSFFLSLLVVILLLITGYGSGFFLYEKYSFFLAVMILNLSQNTFKNIFETKSLNFLGKISYGLYMYHMIAITLCLNVLNSFNMLNSLSLYVTSILLTIFISYISFTYFEAIFMRIKFK